MAESVKRRVAAARLAVAFVAAGTIAGATAWAQAGPPPTAQSSASDIFAKIGDIKGEFVDSSNIDDGSLLYRDFKKGQVPSFKMFAKVDDAFFKYKKAVNNFKYDIKGELGDVNGDISAIKGELPAYIKMSDADARYIKMNDAIMGDGSVFTASKAFSANSLIGLLNVANLVSVDALAGGGGVLITNIGGNDLDYSSCTPPAGGPPVTPGTLKPGESLSCATGQHTEAMQLIGGSGGSEVVTLNFTKISGNITVQILVGM
jgi:hypothetical protein